MTEPRRLSVATASRAASRVWPQIKPPPTWEEFIDWLDPGAPSAVKEGRGYVGGQLIDEQRDHKHVESRSIIVLDADYAAADFEITCRTVLGGIKHMAHTTWRHAHESPRYRLIIPLFEDVSPPEYKRLCLALMDALGIEQFDPSSSQPERFMWGPSSANMAEYRWWVEDGVWFEKNEWLSDAPEPEDDWDGEGPQAKIDFDQPPSEAQIEKAWAVLEKACRELESPLSYGGRNDACIRRLPVLYRFVLGGVLEQSVVDERCWTAVRMAPGDHDFPESEFKAVSRQAWKYAEADGPDRPIVSDDPIGDFAELETSLFDQTTILKHIQTAAYSSGLAAMPMLCCVLGRVLAEVPANYVLPGVQDGAFGDRASLNLGWCFVGQSGTGKTSTLQLSEKLLGINQSHLQRTPSTGQGLIQSYLRWDGDAHENVLRDDPRRVFNVDEISQLAANKDSPGSTLGPELRSMLMGAQTGTENASQGRARTLPASSYRMQLFVGVQPTRAHTLLNDEDAGLPQRFVWSRMASKTIPHPDDQPFWPGPLDWDTSWLEFGGTEQIVIDYPEHLKKKMAQEKWLAKTTGTNDSAEAHLNLTKLKVAAALALLHGEVKITEQWWSIANLIGQLSLLAQDYCRKVSGDQAHEARVAKLRADERAVDAVEDERIRRLLSTAKTKILKAAGEWLSPRDIRPAHRDRHHAEVVWEMLREDPVFEIQQTDLRGEAVERVRAK